MIVERIDLYAHFGFERKAGEQGYLTTYARPLHVEDPAGKQRPAMLVIPGGGYNVVSSREKECVALEFLQQGYNCFTLDYSVAPSFYPTQLLEAALAMLYIRETAPTFATDVSHVGVIGFSAGAHLSAMLSNVGTNKDIDRLLNGRAKDAQPNAAVLCYGVVAYDKANTHTSTFRVVSGGGKVDVSKVDPVQLVTKDTAPAFLWHTADDELVSFSNSVSYALALQKHGVPFELHVFQHGAHGLSIATAETLGNVSDTDKSVSQWVQLAETWLSHNQGFGLKFN